MKLLTIPFNKPSVHALFLSRHKINDFTTGMAATSRSLAQTLCAIKKAAEEKKPATKGDASEPEQPSLNSILSGYKSRRNYLSLDCINSVHLRRKASVFQSDGPNTRRRKADAFVVAANCAVLPEVIKRPAFVSQLFFAEHGGGTE